MYYIIIIALIIGGFYLLQGALSLFNDFLASIISIIVFIGVIFLIINLLPFIISIISAALGLFINLLSLLLSNWVFVLGVIFLFFVVGSFAG